MAKSNYLTTIAIDTEHSTFHFYSMLGSDSSTITHSIKNYGGGHFDDEFFGKFKDAVANFVAENPADGVRKVSVILPDTAVLTDTVKIPTMRGFGQTKKTLDITLGGLYRNYADLQIASRVASQNKQYATYTITAVQKRIATAIYAACSENKLLVDTLTFASNATVGGATIINPKLKNASYLLLDLKDTYARFTFVADGKAIGYYILPFGLEFLRKPKVTQEDMLFDHSYAELSVLNAREKAKSKRLTVMAMESVSEDEQDAEPAEDEQVEANETVQEEESAEETAENTIIQPSLKMFTRKARRLPKFMQREIPETEEGILYENFRVFVKWALTLIASNEKLTQIAKPEFVCVNMPQELAPVLDAVNEETEENGISFTALPISDYDSNVTANLELYGGLFPKQLAANGKF